MEELKNLEKHLENAIEWFWDFIPNLILAIIIFVVGWWMVRFINKMVGKFFDKKDYEPTLESFIQSFINISLKVLLFVVGRYPIRS